MKLDISDNNNLVLDYQISEHPCAHIIKHSISIKCISTYPNPAMLDRFYYIFTKYAKFKIYYAVLVISMYWHNGEKNKIAKHSQCNILYIILMQAKKLFSLSKLHVPTWLTYMYNILLDCKNLHPLLLHCILKLAVSTRGIHNSIPLVKSNWKLQLLTMAYVHSFVRTPCTISTRSEPIWIDESSLSMPLCLMAPPGWF